MFVALHTHDLTGHGLQISAVDGSAQFNCIEPSMLMAGQTSPCIGRDGCIKAVWRMHRGSFLASTGWPSAHSVMLCELWLRVWCHLLIWIDRLRLSKHRPTQCWISSDECDEWGSQCCDYCAFECFLYWRRPGYLWKHIQATGLRQSLRCETGSCFLQSPIFTYSYGRFNHSCAPNAEYGITDEGFMKVRTLKAVPQGETAAWCKKMQEMLSRVLIDVKTNHLYPSLS